MQEQRAMSGSPVTQAAQSALLGNLGGANPAMSGLQQMAGGAQNPALPEVEWLRKPFTRAQLAQALSAAYARI